MKKGDISIQYVFLILIAVVAAFVIIGMLARWSLGADKFMCVLTGECKAKDGIVDKQTILVTDTANPDKFANEVAKHAKICFENMRTSSEVQGELCYTVKCCTDDTCTTFCQTDCATVQTIVEASLGPDTLICSEFGYKAIIEYDLRENKVKIS